MFYQQKYLKYKSKYLTLKKQVGGTKEENNIFILHGTSLFYIEDIKINGLTGIYNQTIYDIITKYWPTISDLAQDPYVDYFIQRQTMIRENTSHVILSFTGKYDTAKEYSDGARQFGEGPSRFLGTLKKYININKEHISKDIITDFDFLFNASQYPGIILAIDKNDFTETQDWPIDYINKWEHTLTFPIPADKLYIRKGTNDYILLLSEEGGIYIDELTYDFLENKRINQEEAERVKLLEGFETIIQEGPELFIYEIRKKNGDVSIKAQYDIYNQDTTPHYLQLTINNYLDISINISIKNNLGTSTYEIGEISKKGFNLFMNQIELKEKFKSVIEGIMAYIPSERRNIIYSEIIKIFPYLNE